MSAQRKTMVYEDKREWLSAVMWSLIGGLWAYDFVEGLTQDSGDTARLVLRAVGVLLAGINAVSRFRSRLCIDAEGVRYCDGLTANRHLAWQDVARITRRKKRGILGDVLILHPLQDKPLRIPCKPGVYAAVEYCCGVPVEEEASA